MPPDSVLAWFGSGYGIVFVAVVSVLANFAVSWLGELIKGRTSQKIETHKLNLRRAELLFEREVEAAKDFIAVRESSLPSYRPGMDSYDADESIAMSLNGIETNLQKFKIKHGVVIAKEIRIILDETIGIAQEHGYEEALHEHSDPKHPYEPSSEAINGAGRLRNNLQKIEDKLLEKISH